MDVPNANQIQILRELVKDEIEKFSPKFPDSSLHRWLLNYRNNVEEIVPKLKFHLRNRQLLGLDCPNLVELVLNPKDRLTRNNHFFLPSISQSSSVDREGSPVVYAHLGVGSAKTFKYLTVREVITHHLRGSEVSCKMLNKLEATEGRIPFFTAVLDLDGLGGGNIHKFLRDSHNITPEIVRNYPGINGRMIILNAPMILDLVGKFLHSLFSHYCEIVFIGYHNCHKHLLKYISEENLPEFYGGTLKNVPLDYQICTDFGYIPVERPLRPSSTVTLWLKPKTPAKVNFTVEPDDKEISWWFETDGDVEFGLYFGEDLQLEHLLIPQFCVSTQHLPDSGRVATVGVGVYTAVFQCPYSRLLKTKLIYSIETHK